MILQIESDPGTQFENSLNVDRLDVYYNLKQVGSLIDRER